MAFTSKSNQSPHCINARMPCHVTHPETAHCKSSCFFHYIQELYPHSVQHLHQQGIAPPPPLQQGWLHLRHPTQLHSSPSMMPYYHQQGDPLDGNACGLLPPKSPPQSCVQLDCPELVCWHLGIQMVPVLVIQIGVDLSTLAGIHFSGFHFPLSFIFQEGELPVETRLAKSLFLTLKMRIKYPLPRIEG